MPVECPSTEQLTAALRGQPSAAVEAELAAHLSECPSCRARLEALAGGSGWLESQVRAHAASNRPASETLHKAIQALESHADAPETDTTSPVKLDFLQPSEQAGWPAAR